MAKPIDLGRPVMRQSAVALFQRRYPSVVTDVLALIEFSLEIFLCQSLCDTISHSFSISFPKAGESKP